MLAVNVYTSRICRFKPTLRRTLLAHGDSPAVIFSRKSYLSTPSVDKWLNFVSCLEGMGMLIQLASQVKTLSQLHFGSLRSWVNFAN